MSKIPFGRGVCCPPSVEGVTYLKIGPQQHTVGLMGLETMFEQLAALERQPDTVTEAELVGQARKSNYIPAGAAIEAEYAAALRAAYARFCDHRSKK